MKAWQLTIDGGEVEHPAPATRTGPLSPVQVEILRHLGIHGWISSTSAGVMAHAHREERRGRSFVRHVQTYGLRGDGCCRYAASDGGDVMKRLAARGLVERYERGVWFPRHDNQEGR